MNYGRPPLNYDVSLVRCCIVPGCEMFYIVFDENNVILGVIQTPNEVNMEKEIEDWVVSKVGPIVKFDKKNPKPFNDFFDKVDKLKLSDFCADKKYIMIKWKKSNTDLINRT
jgi:hypothetical protein